MIRFHEVTKIFRTGQKALDAVNLEIEAGEFVFIVGNSGAGKTTLLRLIIREFLPSEGEIFINDISLNKLSSSKIPHLRRRVGMVFQDFKIMHDLNIFENVSLPLQIAGWKNKKINKKVEEALVLVGLENKIRHFPVQCSAGELQRIALARAVVANPDLVLADEPTGNLDPETSFEIMRLLKKIREKGHTVIVTTHDRAIVDNFEERVVKLDAGKIVKDKRKSKY